MHAKPHVESTEAQCSFLFMFYYRNDISSLDHDNILNAEVVAIWPILTFNDDLLEF